MAVDIESYIIILHIVGWVIISNVAEPLSAADDETIVGPAMDSLPVWSSDESVTVVRNPSSSADASFTFTFESNRGR